MGHGKAQEVKAQVFKGATLTKDNKQQVREGKLVLTEMDKEFGNDWVDVDVAMPDSIEILEKLKEEEDPNLVRVKDKLNAIQQSLDVELPPIDTEKGNETRKKEVGKQDLVIVSGYNELIDECNKILAEGQTEKDKADQIRDIRDKAAQERDELENAVYRFRQILAGSSEESRSRKRTFADALRFQRGEYYDLDDKTTKYSMGGAGTSFIYIIEQKGEKVFFKKDENTSDNPVELIASMSAGKFQLPENLADELGPMIKTDVDKGFVQKTTFYNEFEQKIVFELQDDQYDGRNSKVKLKATSVFPSINKMVEEYNKAKPEQKLAIRNWIIDFGIRWNSDKIAKKSARIKPGSNLTHRHVATSRMATLMELDDIVASSKTATIRKDGQIFTGNAMSEAKSSPNSQLKVYDFSAMKQLMQLQFLDMVCGQVDRKFGNYMHQANAKGTIKTACAIDNDMSFGIIGFESLKKPLTPLNYCMLPKTTIKSIKDIDTKKLRFELMDLLSEEEIQATISRIKSIQNRIDEIEEYILTLSPEEQMIINDETARPLWAMFTYSCNPMTRTKDTLLEGIFMPTPKTLRKNLTDFLKKKGVANLDMSRFEVLQSCNSMDPDIDNIDDDNDE